MDSLPLGALALALACLAALAGLLLWRRRVRSIPAPAVGRGTARPRAVEALDTVASWPPEPSRILTAAERQAWSVLREAVPEHLVLAQVPISRFMRVPTRNSYNEWMRRVGHLCVDLLVCNAQSEVIAVVEVRSPVGESDRTARRHARMDRVVRAAGIALHVWPETNLPTAAAAREAILGADAREGLRAAEQRFTAPAQRLTAFDEPEVGETQELREPPPSTWFDELETAPAPLDARDSGSPVHPGRRETA